MLIDMIHDNHGEPPLRTRFRDPTLLKSYGYQAIVIPDALAALPSAQQDLPPQIITSPNSLKPADLESSIDLRVAAAVAADLQVFFYGDALLLPRTLIEKHPTRYLCDDNSAHSPSPKLCPGKPAVLAALADNITELFDRWPQASGLIMRTGEVYPEATPHMLGSPLHATICPSCRHLTLIDRLVHFIQLMHDTVVVQLQRTYIHRAWQPHFAGLPNMHDDPAVYRSIADRLPQSEQLVFSFKFTRGDFRNSPAANPCLRADARPKWIEFQCEREFEGKGAFPNYQAPAWQKILTDLQFSATPAEAAAGHSPHLSLWGWSRGGGWGGPYVQREEWIDANVFALAQLYANPLANISDIATTWAGLTFGIAESSPPAPAITELLTLSAPAIRQLLYCAALPEDAIAPCVRDDLLDVTALWATALRVVELGRHEEALAEKAEGLRLIDRMRHVWDLVSADLPNKSQARDLSGSLLLYNSFANTVVHLFAGFIHYLRWHRTGKNSSDLAALATEHLSQAQTHWQQHTQHHALLPGAPSLFQENTLWDRTHDCLEELRSPPPHPSV